MAGLNLPIQSCDAHKEHAENLFRLCMLFFLRVFPVRVYAQSLPAGVFPSGFSAQPSRQVLPDTLFHFST